MLTASSGLHHHGALRVHAGRMLFRHAELCITARCTLMVMAPLALLAWLFPIIMVAVVIASGTHYVLDVAGSAVLLTF